MLTLVPRQRMTPLRPWSLPAWRSGRRGSRAAWWPACRAIPIFTHIYIHIHIYRYAHPSATSMNDSTSAMVAPSMAQRSARQPSTVVASVPSIPRMSAESSMP